MAWNEQHKPVAFWELVKAFQAFGGVSMKCLDASEVIPWDTLKSMREQMQRMATELRTYNKDDWPDLHDLADRLDEILK